MQSVRVLSLSASRQIVYLNIRCISSSRACNKYKVEPYKTIDQLLHPVGACYKIHPEKSLYKLLYRQKKENPFFVRPPVGKPSISLETAVASVHSSRVCSTKRIKVLNKLFMRYISEILATSELGHPLVDHNIQLSSVKVGQHYNTVKVYWIPKGTDEDDVIQQLLNKIAYPLRGELINLRLMGLVPPITFAKDKRHVYILDMERRFRIADYGEDYVPLSVNQNVIKKDLRLEVTFSPELRERITSTDEKVEFTEQEERDLPPMIKNTFGLDHEKIMNSILERVNKTKLHNQSIESLIGESVIQKVPLRHVQEFESWDRKAFIQYLKSQRTKRKQMIKARNKEVSDELREASIKTYANEIEVDESEYNEFVKNAFHDIVENFDDDCKLRHEQ